MKYAKYPHILPVYLRFKGEGRRVTSTEFTEEHTGTVHCIIAYLRGRYRVQNYAVFKNTSVNQYKFRRDRTCDTVLLYALQSEQRMPHEGRLGWCSRIMDTCVSYMLSGSMLMYTIIYTSLRYGVLMINSRFEPRLFINRDGNVKS